MNAPSRHTQAEIRGSRILDGHGPWVGMAILVATLLAYFPVFGAGFIWDDAGHVTRPELQSLTGLLRIWMEPGATQQYYPFLHTVFWIEHRLWGDAAAGYHVINVLLHFGVACLFLRILKQLRVPGAAFAAMLFALHPVCVESVAWIAEQKNTLSAVLYLCAARAYLQFDEKRGTGRYLLATGLFVFALLTKSVTATLPAALLVVFWWKNGAPSGCRHFRTLLPWLFIGLASGLFTAWIEKTFIGAQGGDFDLGAGQRVLLAGRIICFYLGKLLWRYPLVFMYPRWTIDPSVAWHYLFPMAVVALFAIAWRWKFGSRGARAAVLLFVGTLVPALGFVNVYPFVFSFVADHFQYLASLSFFAFAGAGFWMLSALYSRLFAEVCAGLVLLSCGVLTWMQCENYHDGFTLYRSILKENPSSWMAEQNLATALVEVGQGEEAVSHFKSALKLRPDYPEAENSYGDVLTRLGRPQEAIAHLENALRVSPAFAEAHNNLGAALMATGHEAGGVSEFREAARLKPNYPLAHFNLGLALASGGHSAEAITEFEKAVALQPNYAEAEIDWAVALTLTNRFSEAAAHFEKALQLQPGNIQAHIMYGRALTKVGKADEAIAHFETALEINPNSNDAHLNLALALRQVGRLQEATQHYQEAVRLRTGR